LLWSICMEKLTNRNITPDLSIDNQDTLWLTESFTLPEKPSSRDFLASLHDTNPVAYTNLYRHIAHEFRKKGTIKHTQKKFEEFTETYIDELLSPLWSIPQSENNGFVHTWLMQDWSVQTYTVNTDEDLTNNPKYKFLGYWLNLGLIVKPTPENIIKWIYDPDNDPEYLKNFRALDKIKNRWLKHPEWSHSVKS